MKKFNSMILVTGGAGFIGANFVIDWLAVNNEPVINLDKLTYAGNPENLQSLQGDIRHTLVQGDIGDRDLVAQLLATHQPRAVINFAAESHVDRSIHGPGAFIHTNVQGTFTLLEAARAAGVARVVFSSTAAVYGVPDATPIALPATTSIGFEHPQSGALVRWGTGTGRFIDGPNLVVARATNRVAVGDHLILGGDNMDLSLAQFLESTASTPKAGSCSTRATKARSAPMFPGHPRVEHQCFRPVDERRRLA